MTRFVFMLAGLLGLALPANAQTLTEVPCPKERTRILVMGDLLAVGLNDALERVLERCGAVTIVPLISANDGLVNTPPQEWIDLYVAATTGQDRPGDTDLVIVQMGANDQGALTEDGVRLSIDDSGWDAAYRGRANELAGRIAAKAARMLWIGLPNVEQARTDERFQRISALQASAARGSGGTALDIWAFSKFGADGFSRNGEIDGRIVQVRTSDRLRFTTRGNDALVNALAPDIARFFRQRDRAAALRDDLLQ